MNQTGISIPFNHGMAGLIIPWQGLGILVLMITAVVALAVGIVYLMNGRRRA